MSSFGKAPSAELLKETTLVGAGMTKIDATAMRYYKILAVYFLVILSVVVGLGCLAK